MAPRRCTRCNRILRSIEEIEEHQHRECPENIEGYDTSYRITVAMVRLNGVLTDLP